MSSLKEAFQSLKTRGKCGLVPYLMGFYPDSATFSELLLSTQDAGADIIEIGIPFSDPIADGPTIQDAGQTALAGGATTRKILNLLTELRGDISVPLVVMSYANLLLQFGLDGFFRKAHRAGVRGVVIPDLILEESASFRKAANRHHVDMIQLAAPTTPETRLKDIASAAQGFIYLISVTGVTGARPGKKFALGKYVNAVRKLSQIPVCVGFGIATPAQAAGVARIADGVIIGSALIEIIRRNKTRAAKAVGEFVATVRKAIDFQGVQSCE